MNKLTKNIIFKSLISTVLFGVVYALLTYLFDGFVDIGEILISTCVYFVIMCLFYFVAPKLRKSKEDDKGND